MTEIILDWFTIIGNLLILFLFFNQERRMTTELESIVNISRHNFIQISDGMVMMQKEIDELKKPKKVYVKESDINVQWGDEPKSNKK